MEKCISQAEGEILTSVYDPILFRRKKTRGKKAVSFIFLENFLSRPRIQRTLLPGDLVRLMRKVLRKRSE